MELIYRLKDIETAAIKFNEFAGSGKIFLFQTEMGSGKTTLIKEICKLNGVEENVCSPTFSIINEYRTATGETIFHLDLYRLQDENEAKQAGVEECIYSGNICYIEWPQKAPGLMPDIVTHVRLEVIDEQTRKLSMEQTRQFIYNR